MAMRTTAVRSRRALATATALASLLAAGVVAGPTSAAEPDGRRSFTAEPANRVSSFTGAKSVSGRYARSDDELLASTSPAMTSVAVKLDYDALTSYKGGIPGVPATSPSVTGRALNPRSRAASSHAKLAAGKEATFIAALRRVAPDARIGQRLRVVYGGIALQIPADKAAEVAAIPGVLAVQRDDARTPLTDSSPEFIGAPTIWSQLGGQDEAGEGVIVGVLDTGIWPEHPSFADAGTLPAPPPKADGSPRTCAFGDNPLTDAADPYTCTNKLIGGASFLETAISIGDEAPLPDTARDFDGHGSHTASTSAGAQVDGVELLGVDRGTIRGIAPAAHVSAYRVCGTLGCFATDSAAAVGQAVLDGVEVINFSISGGTQPYSDPVELAFLDAYDANVFVAASAGNDGPGASTANHLGAWTTTVAASTQDRAFESTLTLTSGADAVTVQGASITAGAGPAPVVVAGTAEGYDGGDLCETPAPEGLFAGVIVVCFRGGNARVEKGYNVLQGGAIGMILVNPELQDVETDTHWLPTVHLDSADEVAPILSSGNPVVGEFTAGVAVTGAGNVMAGFSSRGPAGDLLKPDITAPGVQILAADSPAAVDIVGGPPGDYQAIAGTSMSSPHIAGSAALLNDLHPDWTPGQIKSAIMTTARTDLVKEDGVTPADPFDLGAGHVDLTVAGDPGLTFSETTERMTALGADPDTAIDMNLPSVYSARMPGRVVATRTAVNTTADPLTFAVDSAMTLDGADVSVSPSSFTVAPGASQDLEITLEGVGLTDGTTAFGQITLTETGGARVLHLPVAFIRSPGDVVLTQTCDRDAVGLVRNRAECTVTASNDSLEPATAELTSRVDSRLALQRIDGARRTGRRSASATFELGARVPGTPTIAPGASPAGGELLPLDEFGIPAELVGDEEIFNYDVPAFSFAGEEWSTLGVTSNGYIVVGGGGSEDVSFEPQDLPDPIPPNNLLAPYWTDLDGTGAPGIRVALLEDDAANAWMVVEWDVKIYGTADPAHFQTWIGLNGEEDITYTYDPANLTAPPVESGLTVGAENLSGTGGDEIDGPPTGEYQVASVGAVAGGSQSYTLIIRGRKNGTGTLTTTMVSDAVRGDTVAQTELIVGGPIPRR